MPSFRVSEVHNKARQFVFVRLVLLCVKILFQVDLFSKIDWVIKFDFRESL